MMNKYLKITIGIALVGVVGALYVWFFIYNKPHTDYEKATPEYSLKAKDFFDAYSGQRADANQYTGKVIQLIGTPTLIEEDSTIILVYVFNEGMFGDEGIRCTMLPAYYEEARRSVARPIWLKGYCSGYNGTDIILEYCSITTN